MRFSGFIVVTWLMLAGALAPAHAEKRVALVIGNDRYANLAANEQLQKAANDARAVGSALKGIGFDVIAGENLGRRALLGKLGELIQRLDPGDMAFFFFSGHGVAVDGVNYILPADVPDVAAGQETLLKGEAIGETYFISELSARGVRVAVVVLDACRTNPFSRPGGKGVGVAKGLAPPPQVQGVFSLYAARSGQAALDRLYDGDPNPNSVFSRVLAPKLAKAGLDLRDLAYEVREEVARIAKTAGYDQQPEDHDGTIGGRVYLAGLPPAAAQPPKETLAREPAVSDAERVWGSIQHTTSVTVLDDFIRRYGNAPIYGALAREKREGLVNNPGRIRPTEPAKDQVAMAVDPAAGSATPLTAARERALKPKDTFRECADCPEMVVMPAGLFTMGSPAGEKDRSSDEGPQHVVTIGKPFAVGKLHVTVDQFAAFVKSTGHQASSSCYNGKGSSGSWRDPGFAQEGAHPVVCVSWDDAKAYADWLARKTRKPYRLLSESEWEYAARGRTSPGAYPRFWFGDDEKELCRYGNFNDRKAGNGSAPCDDGYAETSPAGHYQPNAFGLYDMFGNVWQRTEDCWHDNYTGAPTDGSGWTSADCSGRVVRGGAWNGDPRSLRAADRGVYADSHAGNGLGFRLARTLTP